jgi:hypothetical protein
MGSACWVGYGNPGSATSVTIAVSWPDDFAVGEFAIAR